MLIQASSQSDLIVLKNKNGRHVQNRREIHSLMERRRLCGAVSDPCESDGRLAPYQELAYLARPTPAEADYIHGEAVRFAELRAGLLDPQFAATSFPNEGRYDELVLGAL